MPSPPSTGAAPTSSQDNAKLLQDLLGISAQFIPCSLPYRSCFSGPIDGTQKRKKKIQLTFVFLLFLITFLEYISFFKSGFPVGKPFFSVHYYYHFFLLLFKIMIALREMIPLRKMSFRLQETLCCVPSSQRRGDSSSKAHKAHSNYYLQQPGRRACTHRKADSTRIH